MARGIRRWAVLVPAAVLVLAAGKSPEPPDTRPASRERGTETMAIYGAAEITSREPYTEKSGKLDVTLLAEESEKSEDRVVYALTGDEFAEITSAVYAEAGGESYKCMAAVAQCIRNSAERLGVRPTEVLTVHRYTGWRPEPGDGAKSAVRDVFNGSFTVTPEPIELFYAPGARAAMGLPRESEFHESQAFVMEIDGVRFFAWSQNG